MILIIVAFLLSAICAWNMAKCDEEQEAREMAWKLLALAAVEELYKQKRLPAKVWTVCTLLDTLTHAREGRPIRGAHRKKREGEADDSNDRASD